jgi:hypothetical protein
MTMDKDLLKKIGSESVLNADEQMWLDLELESGHDLLRSCVAQLPDESPSLAWRSALNDAVRASTPIGETAERIGLDVALESRPQAEVSRLVQALPEEVPSRIAGAIAFAGAGALALVIALNPSLPAGGGTPPTEATLEARLIAAHQESTSALDLGASNLAPPTSNGHRNQTWSELDLETL